MDYIHVAVGVLMNRSNEVMIAKRADHLHQGGLWEFPGGKVENNETTLQALVREFLEEVAITIHSAEPFIEIQHDYGDKKVKLDVWTSKNFNGVGDGLEGQEIKWVSVKNLSNYEFPTANQKIIEQLCLINFPQEIPLV